MAKKPTYIEPTSYFTPEMMKAAREWDKTHKNDANQVQKQKDTKKVKK